MTHADERPVFPVGFGHLASPVAVRDLGGFAMRIFMDAYNFWVPLFLCAAILGCGVMLGWIWKGSRG